MRRRQTASCANWQPPTKPPLSLHPNVLRVTLPANAFKVNLSFHTGNTLCKFSTLSTIMGIVKPSDIGGSSSVLHSLSGSSMNPWNWNQLWSASSRKEAKLIFQENKRDCCEQFSEAKASYLSVFVAQFGTGANDWSAKPGIIDLWQRQIE